MSNVLPMPIRPRPPAPLPLTQAERANLEAADEAIFAADPRDRDRLFEAVRREVGARR